MIARDWDSRVTHVLREQNKVADWLAGYVFNFMKGLRVFGSPPMGVMSYLENDTKGPPEVRIVGSYG